MNRSSRIILFRYAVPLGSTFLLTFAVLLAGCASNYRFTVHAERAQDVPVACASYHLKAGPSLGGTSFTGLRMERVMRDVRAALSSKGLYEAPAGVAPALEVEIDVGQAGPVQRVLTHAVPVYLTGLGGGSSGRPGGGDRDGATMPRKVGEQTVTTIVTVYPKFLRMVARLAAPGTAPGDEVGGVVWSVLVTNEDESDDLLFYTRLMAAAAMDMIERSSEAPREVVLTDNDGRVLFFEQGVKFQG